ncbi:hypothetical protein GIB67_029349, partial [Kingdonia uniflora]
LFTTKDTGSGRGLSTTKAGGPLRHNSFLDPKPEYRGYPETSGRAFDPRRFKPLVDDDDVPQSNKSFETIRTDVPPSNEPSIPQSNVHLLNKTVLTNVPQSNEPFQTIPTDVHFSNKPCISQLNIYLSNEPVLTNVPPSNEPMLTNVPLSIEPEPIIEQTKTSAEFQFEPQPEYVKDFLDFSVQIYCMRGNFEYAYQLLTTNFAEVRLVDPDFVFGIKTTSCKDKRFTRWLEVAEAEAVQLAVAAEDEEQRKMKFLKGLHPYYQKNLIASGASSYRKVLPKALAIEQNDVEDRKSKDLRSQMRQEQRLDKGKTVQMHYESLGLKRQKLGVTDGAPSRVVGGQHFDRPQLAFGECWNCREKGHARKFCPNPTRGPQPLRQLQGPIGH